ncbi:MAG: ABC transporter permease subunit [Microbacteriaceae bacterium]
MTATTPSATAPSTPTLPAPSLAGIRLRFGGIVRSEWIKLRSLRSTVWCYGLIVLLTIGFGVLLALTFSHTGASLSADQSNAILVQVATLGVNFTQLIVAVLGALVITGEYSTGMIRSTFTAVPGRIGAYIGKAVVLAVSTFVIGLISIVATAVVALPLLSGKGVSANVFDWAVLLPMIGGAGYLTLIALLAFTFGTIVRSSAGAIATILGLLLVVPTILQIIAGITRAVWIQNVAAFLPSVAGGKIFAYQDAVAGVPTETTPKTAGLIDLTSWEGLVVTVAWVLVFGVIAAVLVKRRDA